MADDSTPKQTSENDAQQARRRHQYYLFNHRWQTWLDKKVEEAIGDGNVAHLQGSGQPLKLNDDDDHVPADLRMAHKIMRENDVVPQWMAMGRGLEADREKILRFAYSAAKSYLQRLYEARVAGSFIREREAGERFQAACERVQARIEAYNTQLLTYNTSLPRNVPQRVPLNAEAVLQDAMQAAQDDAQSS